MMMDFEAPLIAKKQLTSDVYLFSFSVPPSFLFIPGQFIMLLLPHEGHTTPRCYSLFNAPSDKGFVHLAVKLVDGGFASDIFNKASVGDRFKMRGPLGHFVFYH